MTGDQRRMIAPVWTLMTVVWFAVAMNWATENEYAHAVLSASLGMVCWAGGEWLRRESSEEDSAP